MASKVLSRIVRRGSSRRPISPSSRQDSLENLSGGFHSVKESVLASRTSSTAKEIKRAEGSSAEFFRWQLINTTSVVQPNNYDRKHHIFPCLVRISASNYSTQASEQKTKQNRKDISTVEDPFDTLTDNIPEKPVTFTEGASYSLIILAGLGVAGLAAYAVFKELIFEPKEYKIFGKALERVQNDSQVTVRIGYPVTGYGQETRNRAARQRIPNRVWTDEDGVEHVEVSFHIRGPHGYGKVYAEMFRNQADKKWTFTYLIVEIKSPSPAQLMLESYVPS
ncbi:putative mitochondrial import inner membrane translocase subunit TIM21 [Canna indica]|uniref:Mitochondrial import inner membrane translocase subunit Tim21 n=1 Tax=Canna indica TaxID=4628 RepID=A0AAQ3JU43_9LILI|nr:putative mitochondrial import inner membrane translocase subunit TIM21 [Canna indica]